MPTMERRQAAAERSIAEQAAEWLLTLEEGRPEDRSAFADWLAQSPQHIGAFLRASAVDSLAGGVDPDRAIPLDAGPFPDIATPDWEATPARRSAFLTWKTYAIATSVILSVVLLAMTRHTPFGREPVRHYAAAVGEQRSLELEDGSAMYLSPGSSVDTAFGPRERTAKLIAGEAMFEVRHDASRPFRVHSGRTVVQAIGTRFSVSRVREDSVVSVVEGVVQLSREASAFEKIAASIGLAAAAKKPIRLAAGQEARATDEGTVAAPRPASVDPVRNWKERRLTFLNESLYAIADEFNRYNRAPKIRIQDAAAGELRFAAAFYADDPRSLATVLKTNPRLIVESTDSEIVIRSRP